MEKESQESIDSRKEFMRIHPDVPWRKYNDCGEAALLLDNGYVFLDIFFDDKGRYSFYMRVRGKSYRGDDLLAKAGFAEIAALWSALKNID